MAKRFVAEGCLYKEGSTIGLSDSRIPADSIDGIIKSSPVKIPVLKSYSMDPNPDNVLGYALLEHRDGGIYVIITFNEYYKKAYESVLQTADGRKENRLGFMISYKHKNGNDVIDGVIRCITLSKDGLGGEIEKFGWEDAR